ncbi:DsbA family protein [Nocardia spumae]|uniref:DsbA family protein n=1 Tax=Nocardia spumae TaxID=2887190 RepID=UPI001D1547DB|nr:thioredoxin domain-containing protein [Nocardia spumae]
MSNRTTYALGAVALVVVAVIVVLVVRWNSDHGLTVQEDGYGAAHDPAVQALLDSDGAIVLGKTSAPKTIDIFEDPMCPSCGSLEHYYGQQIAKQIDAGKFAVRYRFVNFLDPKSSSKDYSTRAVAASECVADAGDGPVFSKFHMALFTTKQPSEDGGNLTNEELASIAKDAGASAEVQQCISRGDRVDSARNHAQASLTALKDAVGQVQTPTVLDGGKNVDVENSDWVTTVAG